MIGPQLSLSILQGRFAVCRLEKEQAVPEWEVRGDFVSITRTVDELSVVCLEDEVPQNVRCEKGWRCFKVQGPLDFSLTGVLASLTAPLAEAKITVFALSTFDTDYLMVKEKDLEAAISVLTGAGHTIRG
jgi:hypothetical protein